MLTMKTYRSLVTKASEDWMNNDCAADRQLYALGVAESEMKAIIKRILQFNHGPSVSDEKSEDIMIAMYDYSLPEPKEVSSLFIVEVLGVVVQVWPSPATNDPRSELLLDISWRPPSTKEDCVVDGKIVDKFVDAIGVHNCKMITFCTGGIDVTGPVDSIFSDPFVVLYKK